MIIFAWVVYHVAHNENQNTEITSIMAIINNRIGMDHNVAGIILLGAGGCGKSTQMNKLLEQGYEGVHIDLGEDIRQRLKHDPMFVKQHGHLISAGKLIPDQTVLKIVQDRARKVRQNGIIGLGGFPRNRHQADMVNNIFTRPDNLLAAEFEVDLDTVMERALRRNRQDDSKVMDRYTLWMDNRKGIIRKLEAKGVKVITLNARGTEDFVFDAFHSHVVEHVRHLKSLTPNRHRPLGQHQHHH